jgi:hypothetical protein
MYIIYLNDKIRRSINLGLQAMYGANI